MLKPLFHVAVLANFVGIIVNQLRLSIPPEWPADQPKPGFTSYGGHWKYLTFINLWLQAVYFAIALVNDLKGTRNRGQGSQLRRLEDFLFSTLALPIGMFVGIMFWGLYMIDREVIFPPVYDLLIPSLANHMLHTVVIPAQIIELLWTEHKFPSLLSGAFTTFSLSLVYIGWILVVAWQGNTWVYPIIATLPTGGKVVFLLGCCLLSSLFFLLGAAINRTVWGNKNPQTKVKSDKHHNQGQQKQQSDKNATGKKKQKAKRYY